MKTLLLTVCLLHGCSIFAQHAPDGFVYIEGGILHPGVGLDQGNRSVRLDDFEIMDHPVTNAEYLHFVEGTGHPPPLHWQKGAIPSGKENHPVIFVNRHDVQAYLSWLNEIETRTYRLPTIYQYEYAARGGEKAQTYPWGNRLQAGQANYDEYERRAFDSWEQYLKPARWGAMNGYGLYGMAGNVWQMTITNRQLSSIKWKYRIENPEVLENAVMGGSWARSEAYLQCGFTAGIGGGIRHPDLGFRLVREPMENAWSVGHRKLCAVSLGNGKVHLSWAMLPSDRRGTAFHIYRTTGTRRADDGQRITKKPLRRSSTYVDEGLSEGENLQYYVRALDASGQEGPRSEWAGVTVTEQANSEIAAFRPLYRQGRLYPVFGDLNGDGNADCVIRLDNGNSEMSQDPGLPVQLEAFTSWGRSLWRVDVARHDHCYGSSNNVPFNVWDMDGDGRAEVITRLQIGDRMHVAILDGLTGTIQHKAPWPRMVTDFQKSSTRIHMSIAYLDGLHPAVVTQTGLYENEVFVAFDAQLNRLWRYNSFAETNGSGGHKIEVADVDGDGIQEVFNGTTCLNADGTLRWSIYRQHPDIVSVHDFLPQRPGLEVFYIVESSVHAGVYMVDADSGEVIWKVNREDDPRWTHGHHGWTADIDRRSPGMECVSNRSGHNDRNLILFSADGRVLMEPFPYGYHPLEWDGDDGRELLHDGHIYEFTDHMKRKEAGVPPVIPEGATLKMTADLYGDHRDELVLSVPTDDGSRYISVVTPTHPLSDRFLSPAVRLDYRLWLSRNIGGGYRSIYDQPLIPLDH